MKKKKFPMYTTPTCAQTYSTASPPKWCLFTKEEPPLTHHNYPKPIVYLRVHSWFCSLWKWKWSRSDVSDSCNPMDGSPPGSSTHGIFWARVLEWVAISFSRGSSWPRNQTRVSLIAGRRFTVRATREATTSTTSRVAQTVKCLSTMQEMGL